MMTLFTILISGLFAITYMLPALLALFMQKSHYMKIAIINLLFGWIPVVWVSCFILSIIDNDTI